jgi:hypothetical protein
LNQHIASHIHNYLSMLMSTELMAFITKKRTNLVINETPAQLSVLPFPVKVPNQQWALISCVGPHSHPSCDFLALRIYGTFASFEEADDAATKAQTAGYDLFDLDIVDISHGFFPLPPPADADIGDGVTYSDKVLQQLMSEHKNILQDKNDRMHVRADEKVDARPPIDVFEDMVTKESMKLFNEWQLKGEVDTKANIKTKLNARFKSNIDTIRQDALGTTDEITEMTAAERKEAHATCTSKGIWSRGIQYNGKSTKVTVLDQIANDPHGVLLPPMRVMPRAKRQGETVDAEPTVG